ncbi:MULTISPECIES: cytochrome d ubiquinol oxidase subunit II [Persicobacter]|uniref:Cytochrome D oxidase subunit I n=1 Tax=Persicobacter diffluens TaxID=981 RepID=A0AAN5AJX0_9BACT|nr:cytochrome d ubiquinol oxidase subunit II [Persicobacter sp. CCB-QB2]GJM59891.1 cytochrome D oxidase subunit I [Persicobacter diffluens]
MDYHVVWYLLVGILLIGYAILDGFDLGVGALHLLSKTDHDRRIMLNSIGPVWDGNEVWLITAGGALFAAFPEVYATAFSSFYLALMFVLVALIFRAVSIEFRSKEENTTWRKTWDFNFFIGSVIAAVVFGVAIGNIIMGIEIGPDKEYHGTFLALFTPYTLMTGVFNLVMFTMHGGVYLLIKTEGKLQADMKRYTMNAYFVFVTLFVVLTGMTLYLKPEMLANFSFGKVAATNPQHHLIKDYQTIVSVFAWLVIGLNVLSIMNIPRTIVKGKYHQAFISSSCTIAALIMLFALGVFPNLVVANDPANSLNIYNSASSEYTLETMFKVAIFGMPFVGIYTSLIYWTYKGKTKIDDQSY